MVDISTPLHKKANTTIHCLRSANKSLYYD